MNAAPQGPTTASNTPAIDGWRSSASSARGMIAVGHDRDQANSASTLRKPSTVALPDVLAPLGVARVDARALDPEEHEHGDEHRAPDLIEQARRVPYVAAAEVVAEHVGVEVTNSTTTKTRIGTILAIVTIWLIARGLLHAAQDHEVEGPDPDRRERDREHGVALAEAGERPRPGST